MELKLWQRVAALETQLSLCHINSAEFDSMVVAALKDDSDRRKQNTARYVIRITNDTTGTYSYGATTHYVDTRQEADDVYTEWFEQDNISALSSTKVEGVEITGAIKAVNGDRLSSVFTQIDRQYGK